MAASALSVLVLLLLFARHMEAPSMSRSPREFWVSVSGTAKNDGTREHPLDLATALSGEGPVRAGDTVWLRGGTYRGVFSSTVTGTASAPIIVRQAPGERATIDSAESGRDALAAGGEYTWFWGFEITSSHPKRRTDKPGPWPDDLRRGYGSVTRARGIRYINLVVHDNANGLGLWSEAEGADAHGNLIYNNGWQGPDRAHGHGIYTQNRTGERHLTDNIIFNQFSHGIHAYGSPKANLNNIVVEGNIVFNNGALGAGPEYERNILIGGDLVAQSPRLIDNVTYFGPGKINGENNVGYNGGCLNLVARGNYLVGGTPLNAGRCTWGSFERNTLHGDTPQTAADKGQDAEQGEAVPSGTHVFVRPNRCEPGRAHVAVFNYDRRRSVLLDLSRAALRQGQRFVIVDAQDYFGKPVAQGMFDGRPVEIVMSGLRAAKPVGAARLRHTAPVFGAFVIGQPGLPAASWASMVADCHGAPADTEPDGILARLLQRWGF
jgi:hypothetical protein